MLQGKYPLLIALVLGLMAGVIAYSAIRAREKAVREGWGVKRVLCAQTDVDEGSELDESMVDVCEIPEKFVTESFIVVPETEDKDSLIPYGQKIIVPLRKGDPILFSHFEAKRDTALSEAIPPKARAISLEVHEKSSVNTLIRPNDHVDVVGTFRDNDGKELIATTVLQNLVVLATGRTTGVTTSPSEEDRKYSHIALLVLPEEAEILALAEEAGTLSLTLRNRNDIGVEQHSDTKTTLKTIFTGERESALVAARAKTVQTGPVQIEILKGTHGSKEDRGTDAAPAGLKAPIMPVAPPHK